MNFRNLACVVLVTLFTILSTAGVKAAPSTANTVIALQDTSKMAKNKMDKMKMEKKKMDKMKKDKMKMKKMKKDTMGKM